MNIGSFYKKLEISQKSYHSILSPQQKLCDKSNEEEEGKKSPTLWMILMHILLMMP